MDGNMDGMLEVYLYENEQLLEKLQEVVLENKDEECFDESAINEIFRVMHTIKGSSGIMMFDNMTKVAHKLEDIFYYLRESHPDNVPHLELVDYVLEVSDFMEVEFEKIKEGDDPDADPTEILDKLGKFLDKIKNGIVKGGNELPEENKQEAPSQFYIAPSGGGSLFFYKASMYYKQDETMSNIRAYSAVYSLKEIASDIKYTPDNIISDEASGEEILQNGFHILLQTQCSKDEIQSLLERGSGVDHVELYTSSVEEFNLGFSDDPSEPVVTSEHAQEHKEEAKKEPAPGDYVVQAKEMGKGKKIGKQANAKGHVKQSLISVNIEKMDALMDLIGELVIAEAVVLQNPDLKVPGLDLSNFQKASAQLSKITSELQDVIMAMRMMPLTNTFQKMNRIVFDGSRKLGKDIELELIGETTEVDKNIIEHISDPLMHLIRNSLDHGIEDKEARIEAGKNPKGKITLEAKNEGGKVYIIVRDDGKGLNRDVILKKAMDNGLLGNRSPETLTDKEVYQFITYAGFSTKESVTELSGRGVGMDVVMKNIQTIGGKLEIDSTPGEGSEMTLKIPLTLAIIDGIVLEVGNTTFVVEIGAIQEFMSLHDDMLIQQPDGLTFVDIRGEYYPLVSLAERYQIEPDAKSLEEGIAAVVEYEGKKVCVFVDRLVAEQEIVVKPIPDYLKKINGISGCTQLGDGSIALIIDIADIA